MISIIVPIYNVEKYIDECMHSVMEQTYTDLEIILVDDGSTDGSGERADDYAAAESRVKVIHQDNAGLSEARNRGIKAASGDHIFLLDPDDMIHSKTLEALHSAIKTEHAQMAICSHVKFSDIYDIDMNKFETNRKSDVRTGKQWLIDLVESTSDTLCIDMITAWGILYDKRMKELLVYPSGRLHEDEYTTYKLLYKSERVAYLDMPLYFYRQRPDSIMGKKKTVKMIRDALDAFLEKKDFYRINNETYLYRTEGSHIMDYIMDIFEHGYFNTNAPQEIQLKKEMKEVYNSLYKERDRKETAGRRQRIKYSIFYHSPLLYKGVRQVNRALKSK